MSNDVILRVNGVDYGGWKEVEIVAGIERQARDFKLAVTRKWPGATDIPRRISQGDVCEVFVGADKMLTGYVDGTPIRYDSTNISVGVTGRSKTADLVDCSAVHKTGQWRGAKIERIAADLARPFGIEVVTVASTGGAVIEHQIQPGETAFESIDRLLTLRQLLATDDGEGRLVFVNPQTAERATTALVFGQNILDADAPLDGKDLFSEYQCLAQRAGTDEDYGDAVAGISAKATDKQVKRYRPLHLRLNGQSDAAACRDRARYEALHRAAKALETTYTVQGWRQGDNTLWLPNLMVHVQDPVIGFDDWLLIVEVGYRISDQGTTASLKVAPAAGYIPSPDAVKAEKKSKSGVESWAGIQAAK